MSEPPLTDPRLLIALRTAIAGAIERTDDSKVARQLRERRDDLLAAAETRRWSVQEVAARALFELGTDSEQWDLGPLAVKIVDAFLRQVLGERFPRDARSRYEQILLPLLRAPPDRGEVLAFYSRFCL